MDIAYASLPVSFVSFCYMQTIPLKKNPFCFKAMDSELFHLLHLWKLWWKLRLHIALHLCWQHLHINILRWLMICETVIHALCDTEN